MRLQRLCSRAHKRGCQIAGQPVILLVVGLSFQNRADHVCCLFIDASGAITNGLMYGAIYALVALGLTLIYGVLHIINFAHGAMLMLALYAAFFLFHLFGIDPYLAIVIVTPAFIFGYVIYRWGVGKLSGSRDQNILLITLGLSIIIENAALFFFTGDQQAVSLSYSYEAVDLGFVFLSYPKIISFFASLVICLLLWVLMTKTDLGRAIRAVAKQQEGARLVGIDVENIFAITFGIGIACLGAAGCMLLPIFYVDPYTGNIFVVIAFTIVVLGGMGSIVGARFLAASSSVSRNRWGACFSARAWPDRHLADLHSDPDPEADRPVPERSDDDAQRHSALLRDRLRGTGTRAARHFQQILPGYSDADILHRLYRPVLEYSRRLCRAILLRWCHVLWHRGLCLFDPGELVRRSGDHWCCGRHHCRGGAGAVCRLSRFRSGLRGSYFALITLAFANCCG